MTVYTAIASATSGRVYYDDGETVFHCDSADGFERWGTCDTCGGRITWCFDCGSIDRDRTTCTCDRIHTAHSHT